MFIFVFIILHVLVSLAASATPHILPTRGGKPAKPHQYPWMLTLQNGYSVSNHNYKDTHDCGASLIPVRDGLSKSDIAVTTAHCVGSLQAACDLKAEQLCNKLIIAGKHFLNQSDQGQQLRMLRRAKCHPNWDNWYANGRQYDIAILKLSSPIDFSSTIQPIPLLKKRNQIEPGTICTVAGWGATKEGARVKPLTLQHANATIENDTTCLYWDDAYSPNTMICAGTTQDWRTKTGVKDRGVACHGDSGGPLMCNLNDNYGPILAGVFFRTDCIFCIGGPDGYAKVSAYVDWIEKTIEELSDL